ncbi:indolethylamine N-methyltransferase-like [Phyllobates terribilis]|uniref:indolethylamine N-methyltransferase-like n=1 Tax=Phyllobates terribilis TaxID=111132 RepID=UPI003CCAE862
MDSCTYKLYHKDGFDSRKYLESYFSDKADMVFGEDFLTFPIQNLIKTFTEGHINGDILVDLSPGPMIHHLFAASEFFKHIIVLKVRDRCIMELKKWADSHTGAFDWGHVTKLHIDIGSSDMFQDKEGKVRSALQHVLKCNLEKDNMMDPMVLPLADCIISAWLLDFICKDQDDYMGYIRKFSRMLKPGGHFIIIGCLDTTYITVGKDKVHHFKYNEDFARKALADEDFVIDCCKVKKRTAESDLIDYKGIIYIAARKKSE